MAFGEPLRRWFLFTVILILAMGLANGIRRQNLYNQFYVEDRCLGDNDVTHHLSESGMQSAVRIEAYRNDHYKTNVNCTITLVPPLGRSIYLQVDSFYFGEYFRTRNNCSDYLEIFGKYGNSTQLCGYHGEHLGFSTRGKLTMQYVANEHRLGTGFSLTATVFRSSEFFYCDQGDFFVCANSRCIWNGLTCDGVNNCEDDSDEKSTGNGVCAEVERFTMGPIFPDWDTFYPTSSFPNYRESTNITVGAAICSGFILIFAVAVRFYCYYQCVQARRNSIASRIAIIRTRSAFRAPSSPISGSDPPPYTTLVNDPVEQQGDSPPEYSTCVNPAQAPTGPPQVEDEKAKLGDDLTPPSVPGELPPAYAP